MSTELQVMDAPKVEITTDQIELIKKTVAVGATNDELKLYFYDCQRRGVHPLDGKIYFTKRKNKDGTYKYTPLVAIDFLRELGHRTGQCLGVSDPVFSGTPGKPDFQATVTIKRLVAGHVAEFTATARWQEYCPPSGLDFMWQKMKHTLLGKCAEALAWRKGFADSRVADLHIHEEFDQDREEPLSMSKAMVAAFPPGEELTGLLVRVEPKQGSEPAKAFIKTLDGIMGHEILDSYPEYQKLVGCEVVYRYGKNGKFRPIEEMRLKEIKATVTQVEGPKEDVKAYVLDRSQTEDDRPILDDERIKAYAAQFTRGMVLDVQEKTSKKGPYHRLKIQVDDKPMWGSVWHSPGHFGLEAFEQLADCDVFFLYTETPNKAGGAPFINIDEIVPEDVFEQYILEKVKGK